MRERQRRADAVLLVTDEMEVGGSQRQIVHLLRGLKRAGRQPQLLYFRRESFLVEQLRAEGIPVSRIDKRGAIVKRYVGEPDFAALHVLVDKLLAEA